MRIPHVIRLEFRGQRELHVDENGDLVVSTGSDAIRWKHPEIYQEAGGARTPVQGRFVVAGRDAVGFEIGPYDRGRVLTIDPTFALGYSTYLGGSKNEGARGIGVDGSGNIYLAGNTTSSNLAVTAGALQATFGGQTASYLGGDAFVAKFSPTGALIYLTYLGGSADDGASALAVDSAGNVYLTGQTTSTDFPVVKPYQKTFGGFGGGSIIRTGDAFVAKLNPSGNQLIYSTYLGGTLDDEGTAIAIDSAGNAYVAGSTQSPDFPVTAGVYQGQLKGTGGEPIKPCCKLPSFNSGDAFVAKLDPTGSTLVFSTFLGGHNDDLAFSIALDASNDVYVAGCTISTDFPVTAGVYQKNFGGSSGQNSFLKAGDGFVTKLNPTGTALISSTYFGGPGDECIGSIALDPSGNVYMTGYTNSELLQTTAGVFQPNYKGYLALPNSIEYSYGDAFVAKLNPAFTELIYLSYLGGSANDAGTAIAVDSLGNAYVTGFTDSTDFPLAGSPYQSKMAGDGGQAKLILYGDAFLAVVNPTATALIYSTYYGGSLDDVGFGIVLDGTGKAYIAGETVSSNLPTTSTAAQRVFGGAGSGSVGFVKGDAFYTTFSGFPPAPPVITSVVNAFGSSPIIGPNSWVAIRGTGLAPDVRSWETPDFVNNLLPTQLDGVSVSMNGQPAYVEYISQTQINVLTPPYMAAGPVTVTVTNAGSPATFTAQAQTLAMSLFVFDTQGYVVATHLFPGDVGPTSLYPGLTTPAKPGEEIVVYGNGFGFANQPVFTGSLTQSGSLTTPVTAALGSQPAQVVFAGLISPGLWQFNIVLPTSGVPNGDNQLTLTYSGQKTQVPALITVQQ